MPLAGRREVKGKFPPAKVWGGVGEAISPLQGKGWWSLGGGLPLQMCGLGGVFDPGEEEGACLQCSRRGALSPRWWQEGCWPWERAREGVCPRGESVAGSSTWIGVEEEWLPLGRKMGIFMPPREEGACPQGMGGG